MRIYSEETKNELQQVICNACGRKMLVEKGIVKEGLCSCQEKFGYFSDKDGQIHQFDLCERCYDEIIKNFKIPVEIEESNEMV